MSKDNTKKIAKMVLNMFDGNVVYAYEYSIGLMKVDIEYASVASYFESILPPKEPEEVTPVVEEVKPEKKVDEPKPTNYTKDDIPEAQCDVPPFPQYGPGTDKDYPWM